MNSSSLKQRHLLYIQRAIQLPPLFLSNLWPCLSRSALENIYAWIKSIRLYCTIPVLFSWLFIDASCPPPPPDQTENLISHHEFSFWLHPLFHLLSVPAALAAVNFTSSSVERSNERWALLCWTIMHCTWRWILWNKVMNEFIEIDSRFFFFKLLLQYYVMY